MAELSNVNALTLLAIVVGSIAVIILFTTLLSMIKQQKENSKIKDQRRIKIN